MRKLQRNAVLTLLISVGFACAVLFVRPSNLLGKVMEKFDDIPMALSGWKGENIDISDYTAFVPNSSLLMRDYTSKDGKTANLTIVYGLDVSDIHNPEYCFEGQGWKVLEKKIVTVHPVSGKPHPARATLLDDATGEWVMSVYWFTGPHGPKIDLAHQRMQVWRHVFASRRVQPSAVVRILVPVIDGKEAALRDALAVASAVDDPVTRMVKRKPTILPARRVLGE